MVSAELILVSEGCRSSYDRVIIIIFLATLYLLSTVFLMVRIHQNIILKREVEMLKSKLREVKKWQKEKLK